MNYSVYFPLKSAGCSLWEDYMHISVHNIHVFHPKINLEKNM